MKRNDLKQKIKEEIIEILSEQENTPGTVDKEIEKNKKFQDDLLDTKKIIDDISKDFKKLNKDMVGEDEEPTSADLKKKDSVTTIGRKLQEITKEMKNVLAKYKKSEGSEKEKHLERLKELTKIKKELESAL